MRCMKMTNEDAIFDILLSRQEGTEVVPGLKSGGFELRGREFPRDFNNGEGVADSVEAVQNAGLVQVPSYALIGGRASASKEEPVWSRRHDTLGERMPLNIEAHKYDGITGDGVYVVDLIGAGLFISRRPSVIREAVRGNTLVNRAMPISDQMKATLLGEKSAYRWNGRELKQVPVQVFDSYAAFEEASKGRDFQDKLADMSAIYAVLRPVAEAQRNPSDYRNLDLQAQNPDLIIPSGGKAPLQAMLARAESFKWEGIGSYHDGYQTPDTGRLVMLNSGNSGVDCNSYLNDFGRSVGVAPEALKARSAAQKMSLDAQVEGALRIEQPFEYNGRLWAPLATGVRVYR